MIQADNKYVIGASPLILLFSGWTNVSWNTFTSSGQNISSAIESSGSAGYADTELLPFTSGDKIYFKTVLTLNTGSYPANTANLHLIRQGFGVWATITLWDLYNNVEQEFSINATDNFGLRFQNYGSPGNAVNCSCDFLIYKK